MRALIYGPLTADVGNLGENSHSEQPRFCAQVALGSIDRLYQISGNKPKQENRTSCSESCDNSPHGYFTRS